MGTRALIRRIADENVDAYERFYAIWFPRLTGRGMSGSYRFDKVTAEDVAQDVCVKIHRFAKQCIAETDKKTESWVWMIWNRTALNHLRKKKSITIYLDEFIDPDPIWDFNPDKEDKSRRKPQEEHIITRPTEVAALWECTFNNNLESLPDEERIVLELWYEGYQGNEISVSLGRSESWVSGKLKAARNKFRRSLKEHE